MKLPFGMSKKKSETKTKKRPDICLSLNCKSFDELKEEIVKFRDYAQIIEWCVEMTEGSSEYTREEFEAKFREVKKLAGNRKVTVDYKGDLIVGNRIQRWAMGIADIIDIDVANPEKHRLVREAKRAGTLTLISCHDYEKMPSKHDIAEKYLVMEQGGGDILKIACYAANEVDTYEILEGAAAYVQLKDHKPIVAIAMGEEGQVSRICAGDFGSVISYACGSKPTAPGQFNAEQLSKFIDRYYSRGEEK